jgi:predicted DNA-binding WGR domain protein
MSFDEKSNWVLLYKSVDGAPNQFCEVRRVDSAVWVRSGRTNTWGTREIVKCKTSADTAAKFKEVVEQQVRDGFELTREGIFNPKMFDYEGLTYEIYEGARKAFTAAREAHKDDNVNLYALYSDSDAMTIVSIAGSTASLEDETCRWCPEEWSYNEGDEFLDIAYRLILTQHQDLPSEIDIEKFRAGVFEAAVSALERLDKEGFFGSGEQREECVILFEVSDDDLDEKQLAIVKRLNTAKVYNEYYDLWKSWRS